MNGLLFGFVAVLLAGLGARDQLLLGHLSARAANRYGLLAVAVLTGVVAAGIAGWAAYELAPTLLDRVRTLIAGIALVVAGLESLFMPRPSPPKEPTLSLGAAALVFFAHQVTDAARLIIFALAVSTGTRLTVAGGVLGGVAALLVGFADKGSLVASGRLLGVARRVAGVLLLLAGALVVLYVTGVIDPWGRA